MSVVDVPCGARWIDRLLPETHPPPIHHSAGPQSLHRHPAIIQLSQTQDGACLPDNAVGGYVFAALPTCASGNDEQMVNFGMLKYASWPAYATPTPDTKLLETQPALKFCHRHARDLRLRPWHGNLARPLGRMMTGRQLRTLSDSLRYHMAPVVAQGRRYSVRMYSCVKPETPKPRVQTMES
jgi:hypothetical protein